MLNNSFTKTNTIFGQALGCTALDDAFVKLLSDVNADGVTQFLVRTNGEEKMKTVNLWSAPIVAGFCSRFVLCNIYKTFFRSRHQFYRLMPGEGVRIADNESISQNPNT